MTGYDRTGQGRVVVGQDAWMQAWMNGWMDGWMDGWLRRQTD